MNYIYVLTKNTVHEHDAVTYEAIENWHIDSLKANNFKYLSKDSNIKLKHITLSYIRTLEWVSKNHPELLL